MSEVVLCGETALIIYRIIRANGDNITMSYLRNSVRCPTPDEIEQIRSFANMNSLPIEVLLHDSSARNKSCNCKQKYFSSSRFGVVAKINSKDPFYPKNVMIVSPSFMIAQRASEIPLWALLYESLELSGTYVLDTKTGLFISNISKSVTKKTLNGMVEKLGRSRWSGINNLRMVARHVEENSASPMESELFIKMTLPTRLGGLGIDGIKMNERIDLSMRATKISGQLYVVVDFLHPKYKVVIEYDSRIYHGSVEQSQKDKRRRDALQNDGYICFSIVPQQISTSGNFNACMNPIIKCIKGRCRIRSKNFKHAQTQLLNYFNSLHKNFDYGFNYNDSFYWQK